MIRVALPYHLRTLAAIEGTEVLVEAPRPATVASVLDALEAAHPVLRGTLRDPTSGQRRPMIRYFACNADWSFEPADRPLPEAIITGQEPLILLGAISGG